MANITLNENPQLNLEMEAMTVNTEGHCDEWNRRHKQLLENDHYLSEEQKKNNEPEFTVAEKRENIASKEKMPKILGKIAKFFTDLKTVAFSGKYSDLDGKPAIVNNNTATEAGSALDARQANPTIEGTMANQISQLNSDLSDLSGRWFNRNKTDFRTDTDHPLMFVKEPATTAELDMPIDVDGIYICMAPATQGIVLGYRVVSNQYGAQLLFGHYKSPAYRTLLKGKWSDWKILNF